MSEPGSTMAPGAGPSLAVLPLPLALAGLGVAAFHYKGAP